MSFNVMLQNLCSALASSRGQRHDRRRGVLRAATLPFNLEVLEDRCLLTFNPAAIYDVGTSPQAVVTADFNNDGQLDLATANLSDKTVSVLLGNGDGSFQPAPTSTAGGSPGSLAAGDFNGDGNLDLATVGGFKNGFSYGVNILLGNGDGTFQSPYAVALQSPSGPVSVGVADFNADQKMDLVVVTHYWDLYNGSYAFIEVLKGDGTGGFTTSQVTEGNAWPWLQAIDDLNADGIPDLLVSQYEDGIEAYVHVWLGNGSGAVEWSGFYTGPGSIAGTQASVGDFTGDGILDLVIAGETVDILPGVGDGTFAAAVSNTSIGYQPSESAVSDFDGDGNLDLVVTSREGAVSVLLGDGAGNLAQPTTAVTGGSLPFSIVTGDFNGDGGPDVAAANSGSNTLSVLLNDGDWSGAPIPLLQISNTGVTEGNTGTVLATFTVSLTAPSSQTITVDYETADATAVSGSDYQAVSGTLTFAPGEISKAVPVLVNGDRLAELNETFVVNLSAPTNATIADGQGIGTILDDEPRISINDVSTMEGNGQPTNLMTFTIRLSIAYDQAVTVNYATANGTARAGNDYQAKAGTATIAAGQTSTTVAVAIIGDTRKEANETFFMNLSGAVGGLIADGQGVGTILDDDGRPKKMNRHDAALMALNFGRMTDATEDDGDFTGDGCVDLADLAYLQAQLESAALPPAMSPSAVIANTDRTPANAIAAATFQTNRVTLRAHVRRTVATTNRSVENESGVVTLLSTMLDSVRLRAARARRGLVR